MGMYDIVKVDVNMLPITEEEKNTLKGASFQTKDLDCELFTVNVMPSKATIKRCEYEFVPQKDRPYPNDPGIKGLAGMMKEISHKIENIDTDFKISTYKCGKSYVFSVRVNPGRVTITKG